MEQKMAIDVQILIRSWMTATTDLMCGKIADIFAQNRDSRRDRSRSSIEEVIDRENTNQTDERQTEKAFSLSLSQSRSRSSSERSISVEVQLLIRSWMIATTDLMCDRIDQLLRDRTRSTETASHTNAVDILYEIESSQKSTNNGTAQITVEQKKEERNSQIISNKIVSNLTLSDADSLLAQKLSGSTISIDSSAIGNGSIDKSSPPPVQAQQSIDDIETQSSVPNCDERITNASNHQFEEYQSVDTSDQPPPPNSFSVERKKRKPQKETTKKQSKSFINCDITNPSISSSSSSSSSTKQAIINSIDTKNDVNSSQQSETNVTSIVGTSCSSLSDSIRSMRNNRIQRKSKQQSKQKQQEGSSDSANTLSKNKILTPRFRTVFLYCDLCDDATSRLRLAGDGRDNDDDADDADDDDDDAEDDQKRQKFANKRALNEHLLSAHRMKAYRCLFRDCKSFDTSNKLGVHLRAHHRHQRVWRCDRSDCAKQFRTWAALRHHHYKAHQYGRFECLFAGCRFHANARIKLHVHYTCAHELVRCDHPGCGKSMIRTSLYSHKWRMHGPDNSRDPALPAADVSVAAQPT